MNCSSEELLNSGKVALDGDFVRYISCGQGNLQKMQAERSQVQEWLEETKTDLMEAWREAFKNAFICAYGHMAYQLVFGRQGVELLLFSS